MNEVKKVVQKLELLDVGFVIKHRSSYGQKEMYVGGDELLAYVADPIGFMAAHYGVTKDVLLDWHRSEYRVVCAGTTLANKPCKGTAVGGSNQITMADPKNWLAMQGGYCEKHGG